MNKFLQRYNQKYTTKVDEAGGVGDGRSIAAAFALGAQGVQAGTMFLVATECPVPDNFKAFIIAATESSTVVTGRKMGAPVRSLKNKMIDTYIRLENENVSRDELEELTMGSARKAAAGDIENGSVMAGQICGLLKEIKPAKQIIKEAFAQAKKVADSLSARLVF